VREKVHEKEGRERDRHNARRVRERKRFLSSLSRFLSLILTYGKDTLFVPSRAQVFLSISQKVIEITGREKAIEKGEKE